jgi:phosphoenolpyruvate carboxykinase (ATP)
MATQTQPQELQGQSLNHQGLTPSGAVHWNLVQTVLLETALRRGEGQLADNGPFTSVTAPHTGRSPNDKFVVREPSTEKDVDWGKVNQPIGEDRFELLLADVRNYLNARADLFVQDLYCGADPKYRLSVRYVSPSAWHMAFVRNMFIRPDIADLASFDPNFTVLHAPEFEADPARHGTRTGTFIVLNLAKRIILIGGTRYAGELKKSMFTVMNYYLPKQGVLSMHCSANTGKAGDTALFFGLSGTGKTTLSADPHRDLIGDDEHGWSPEGTFNFEGGCYAKVINLSPEAEPDIYRTTQMFGTVLENVVLDPVTRKVKFDDQSITENTRASYPLHYIPNFVPNGRGGHPKNIVFLTADAYGVLPPVAKLTRDQAMYYFLSGYTAKVAGTEKGLVGVQPEFSTCFGAPFLPRPPAEYGNLFRKYITEHNVDCWLVNSGWTGGKYGEGRRMPIKATRALVTAALDGSLKSASFRTDPYFGFSVPTSVPGIEPHLLYPMKTWRDKAAFDKTARDLVKMFQDNFTKFEDKVDAEVRAAAPEVRLAAE